MTVIIPRDVNNFDRRIILLRENYNLIKKNHVDTTSTKYPYT